MLVTTTGPERSVQLCRNGVPGSTSSSVAETEMTCAGMPARVTATGARKPCPWIVTAVKGASTRWRLLSIAVIWSAVTNRKPLESVASWPEFTRWTRTLTVAFRFGRPGPDAGGVETTIWLNDTLTTFASTGPKKTWSGWENPDPKIETSVLPSSGAEDGTTAVMVGVEEDADP